MAPPHIVLVEEAALFSLLVAELFMVALEAMAAAVLVLPTKLVHKVVMEEMAQQIQAAVAAVAQMLLVIVAAMVALAL